MITSQTEFCSNCQAERELKYRRLYPAGRGHWLCVECSFPIRDFNNLAVLLEDD